MKAIISVAVLAVCFVCVEGHRRGSGAQNYPAFLQNASAEAVQAYYSIVKNSTASTVDKQTRLLNWANYYHIQNFDVNTAMSSNGFGGRDSGERFGRGRRTTTQSPFQFNNGNGGFGNGGMNSGFGGIGSGAFPGGSGNGFGGISSGNSGFNNGVGGIGTGTLSGSSGGNSASGQFGGFGSQGGSTQFGGQFPGFGGSSGSSQFGGGNGQNQFPGFGGSPNQLNSFGGQNLYQPFGRK